MGVVTTFEWEMLFPDRADFLILLPLGLKARQLFYSKGKALLSFLCMFLVAANLFASIFFPAVSTPRRGNYWHAIYAHGVAVTLSGVFAAFAILAIEGLSMCLLPARWFRAAATILQLLSITFLLVTLLLYPLVGGHLDLLLVGQSSFAGLLPPLWFIGALSVPSARYIRTIGLRASCSGRRKCHSDRYCSWHCSPIRSLGDGSKYGRSRGTVEVRKHAGNLVSGLLRKTLAAPSSAARDFPLHHPDHLAQSTLPGLSGDLCRHRARNGALLHRYLSSSAEPHAFTRNLKKRSPRTFAAVALLDQSSAFDRLSPFRQTCWHAGSSPLTFPFLVEMQRPPNYGCSCVAPPCSCSCSGY